MLVIFIFALMAIFYYEYRESADDEEDEDNEVDEVAEDQKKGKDVQKNGSFGLRNRALSGRGVENVAYQDDPWNAKL